MMLALAVGRPALCLVALASLTAAWPTWLPHLDSLVVRQDTGGNPAPPAETTSPTRLNPATTANLNTASIATDASGNIIKPTGTGSSNNTKARPTEFDPRDPAGNVVMITPAATLGTQLYKIGDFVTWGWNYTNLQATPTAINVLVSCSKASETWTLTSNMTFATIGSYTWDTNAQATAVESPLLTEQYTLIIYDADAAITDTPQAGYLGTFSQFSFGMYTPQPYTPLNEWNCATCNAAMPSIDKRAVGLALSMSTITFLSFTWFVTGLGLF